jgi:hypothetical protein
MVEQLTLNQLVEGSSPSRCTRYEKGRSAISVPFLVHRVSVMKAVPEGVRMFAAVTRHPEAEIHDPGHQGSREDQPEIPGCRIRVPEVGRRAQVEKCGKQLRDCHGYIMPNFVPLVTKDKPPLLQRTVLPEAS